MDALGGVLLGQATRAALEHRQFLITNVVDISEKVSEVVLV